MWCGVLPSTGSQRVGHKWATEQQQYVFQIKFYTSLHKGKIILESSVVFIANINDIFILFKTIV